MNKSVCVAAAVAFAACIAVTATAQVSLEVDGASVASNTELESISYESDSKRLEISTIFEDIRCVPNFPDSTVANPSDSVLVIDQVNPEREPDAEKPIAVARDGGAISYLPSSGVLAVTTSGDKAEQLMCSRIRTGFWNSGFEDLFKVALEEPASPFPVGGTLIVRFTIENISEFLIATDASVDFATSTVPSEATGVSAPLYSATVSDATFEGDPVERWTVPSLWPGDSETIEVSYSIDAGAAAGTMIKTEAVNVSALNRVGDRPLAVGTAAPVVSEVTTGSAEVIVTKTQIGGPDPVTAAGQELEYKIVVQNTGTIAQTGGAVVDTLPDGNEGQLTDLVESGSDDGVLSPTETWTLNGSYTVTQGDIDAGDELINTASFVSEQLAGAVDGSAVTPIQVTPDFTLTKVQDDAPTPASTAGQVIPYTITLTNVGQVTLTGVAVSDTLPDGSPATLTVPTESLTPNLQLDVGETWTYTTTYTVTQADLNAGSPLVNNVAAGTDQTPPKASSARTLVGE